MSSQARENQNLMGHTKDARVDSYIDALPHWQQAICREVRDIVHSADPDVVETIKFGIDRTSCWTATSALC